MEFQFLNYVRSKGFSPSEVRFSVNECHGYRFVKGLNKYVFAPDIPQSILDKFVPESENEHINKVLKKWQNMTQMQKDKLLVVMLDKMGLL